MASKQPIRIDTVQIEFDVPKSPFEDIEKSIKDVTSGIDESTKDIKKTFKDAFKDITKSADEISLENGIKDLEYMQSEIQHLTSEYDKAKHQMKSSPFAGVRLEAKKSVELIGRDLNELVADYQKTSKSVSDLQKKIANTSGFKKLNTAAKSTINNIGRSVKTKAITPFKNLKQSIKNIDFEKLKKEAKESLSEISNHANKAREHFGKMGQAIGGIPSLLAGIGVTMGMKEVLDFANEISTSGNSLEIKTTLSGANLKQAKSDAQELYNQGYGESLTEVSNAFAAANQMTGKTGNELKGLAEGALNLSKAFEFDVKDSVKSVDMLMSQFGMTGDEAYDLIIQGTKLGLDNNGELLDTINEYSVKFKNMGFTGYEMFDMLSSSAEAGGWSVDKVADSFKEFSIRGLEANKTTAEGFELIGKDTDTMIAKFAAGGDKSKEAFQEVIEGIAGIQDAEAQNAAGVALFGTMWEDLGKDAVLAMGNAKQATKEGTAELEKVKELNFGDLYSQMAQTFRPVMSGMATELNTLFTENKAVIQEFAQSIADGLLKAFQWIIDNKESLLKWAKALGTAFLVFKAGGIVSNGIKGVSETFKTIGKIGSTLKLDKAFKFLGDKGLKGMKTFAKFIGSGFVKSLSLLKAGFLKMIPAIWSAITATWSFTVALLANPITWIVIGVIALIAAIVLLIKNWDKVKEVFGKAWQWFTTTVIEPLKAKFQELGQKISEFFSNAWNWIKSVWSTVTAWFNTTIIQPVLNFFRNLGTSISNVFSTAWNWIKSVWSAVTSWFNSVIIQPVLNFFRNLGTGISSAFSSAWNLIKSVWNAVTSWFTNTIINPVKQKFTSLKDGIKTAFSSAWTAVKGIWNKAAGWFEDTVVGPIKKGFNKLKEGWDTVKEGFGTAKSKIGGGLKSVGQAIGIPGLASGGVFEANNPFLAVLGDQTRGNNIETPEGLLRQIVREESHGYTPAGSVSNSVSNSKSSESYNYNPVFNISISGSIDNRNTERKIKEIFKKSMDEYAESMMRRNPRLTGV